LPVAPALRVCLTITLSARICGCRGLLWLIRILTALASAALSIGTLLLI
jgi:hypothetical protein